MDKILVRFEKVNSCTASNFKVVPCFSHSGFTNISDMCDHDNPFSVINSIGTCINAIDYSLDEAAKAAFEAQAF